MDIRTRAGGVRPWWLACATLGLTLAWGIAPTSIAPAHAEDFPAPPPAGEAGVVVLDRTPAATDENGGLGFDVVKDTVVGDTPAYDPPPYVAGEVVGDGPWPVARPSRPRPPEPPPPGVGVEGWDLDHLNPLQDMPAPLPRGDFFTIRELPFRHDTRLVSLDGRRTPIKRVPQWVEIIERDELREWRPYDLGFFAKRRPNVTIGDGGNPFLALPKIRGLGGDRVKILTDGVWPVTQALGSQGATLSLWDPESTERVEIFNGPGAYLRAIDAPGGMINIVPRRPRQHGAFGADWGVRTSYDSATEKFRNRVETDVGGGRIAALIGATYTSVGNRMTPSGELDPSDYDQVAADVALDYFLTPRSRLGLTAHYVKADNIDAPGATGTAFADPSYERVFLGLSVTSFDVGDIFHGSRLSLSLDSFLQDDDRGLNDVNAGIGSEDDVTRANFHMEGTIDLLCGHDTFAELSIGYAHLRRTETLLCIPVDVGVTGPGTLPAPITPVGGSNRAEIDNCEPVTRQFEAEELLVTAMLEDQVHCDCWDAYGGVRVDAWWIDDSRFDDEQFTVLVSGAAGYVRHINKRVSAYVNASLGWRRPSIFERTATEIVDGRLLFANENLDPELHGNAEVGVKGSLGNRVSLQAASFAHYIDETIAPQELGGGDAILQNRSEVWLYGGEIEAAWRPLTTKEGLELFASAGITRSSDTDLVDHVPVHYRGGVRYSVPTPKGYRVRRWFAEVSAHGAQKWEDGPRSDDSYLTADLILGAGLDFGCRRQASFRFGLTNLLDEDYIPVGGTLRAPERSFFASAEIDF